MPRSSCSLADVVTGQLPRRRRARARVRPARCCLPGAMARMRRLRIYSRHAQQRLLAELQTLREVADAAGRRRGQRADAVDAAVLAAIASW